MPRTNIWLERLSDRFVELEVRFALTSARLKQAPNHQEGERLRAELRSFVDEVKSIAVERRAIVDDLRSRE
jgi:hypothetical protein